MSQTWGHTVNVGMSQIWGHFEVGPTGSRMLSLVQWKPSLLLAGYHSLRMTQCGAVGGVRLWGGTSQLPLTRWEPQIIPVSASQRGSRPLVAKHGRRKKAGSVPQAGTSVVLQTTFQSSHGIRRSSLQARTQL